MSSVRAGVGKQGSMGIAFEYRARSINDVVNFGCRECTGCNINRCMANGMNGCGVPLNFSGRAMKTMLLASVSEWIAPEVLVACIDIDAL